MTSLRLVGAALVAASALATPAFAQVAYPTQARCAFTDPNCQIYGPDDPFTRTSFRHPRLTQRQLRREMARREMARREMYRNNTGFGPLNAAGALAGAAVGTAATIATAPFAALGGLGNSYAAYGYTPGAAYGYTPDYDTGYLAAGTAWNGNWDSYAAHNGIVCRPGTYFKGSDGLQHLCQ